MHIKSLFHVGLPAILSAMLISGCAEKDPTAPKFVLAEGKGVKVTRAEVDKLQRQYLDQRGVGKAPLSAEKLAILDRMIVEQRVKEDLLLKESESLDAKEIAAKTEEKLGSFRSKFPSEEVFQGFLKQQNLTMEEVKTQIGRGERIQAVLEKKVPVPAPIPLATVEKYYKDNAPRFMDPPTMVRASHVLIMVPPDAGPETKQAKAKAAEAARARVVAKGGNFAKVAKEVSDDPGSGKNGGDLGMAPVNAYVGEFAQMATDTKVGEVSPVFETQYGYHFLKVFERKPGKLVPFEDVKDMIFKEMASVEQGKKMEAYLEALVKDANVTYHLPETPKPPVSATPQTK